jgi:hypothetical protein
LYDSTLKDELASRIGILGMYEVYASHLRVRDEELDRNVTQLDILIRNAELINILRDTNQGGEELDNRYRECLQNMDLIIERMRGMNVLEKDFGGYGYRTLYEVVTMGLKNKMMEIQGRIKRKRSNMRE